MLMNSISLDKYSPKQYNDNYKHDTSSSFAMEFKDVSFKYFNSSENIFEDLNLHIDKNLHTIITGPNGSGKKYIIRFCSLACIYLKKDLLQSIL